MQIGALSHELDSAFSLSLSELTNKAKFHSFGALAISAQVFASAIAAKVR